MSIHEKIILWTVAAHVFYWQFEKEEIRILKMICFLNFIMSCILAVMWAVLAIMEIVVGLLV